MSARLLDLFCCAGGASMGYRRAGFEVVGVDNRVHYNYPFEFIWLNALDVLETLFRNGNGYLGPYGTFDAIHASPPCQFGTAYKRRQDWVRDSPNLIPDVRVMLVAIGLPWVIENNWCNRAHLDEPVMLCGSMFGLDVQRHRGFETGYWKLDGPACDHSIWTPRFPPATNRANLRKTVEVGVWRIPMDVQNAAMGIDWMTREELSQAVPPAYTEHIGRQLMEHLTAPTNGRSGRCLMCGTATTEDDWRTEGGRLCGRCSGVDPAESNGSSSSHSPETT